MSLGNTLRQASLRDVFIKRELKRIRVEGIDADEVYIEEIIKRCPKGCKILDIGTGTAHIPVSILKKKGEDVEIIAVDISLASVKIAKKNISKYGNVHLLRADGYNLPFKDSSFNEVIVRLAPHSIREAYRVLKENGWYIHRACGQFNCWKEIHEVFGERAFPYAKAEWWKTSFKRLERYNSVGFKDVYEMAFLVKKYYTFEQMVKEMLFNPIVRNFDLKRDIDKLKELERRFGTKDGIRITADPLIILARK